VTVFLQSTVEGLSLAAVYLLLAMGFVIIYKATQVFSFAQPALMMVGGYLVSELATRRGLPFWAALLVAMAATTLLAGTIERLAVRPLLGKPIFAVAILTLGIDIALRVVVTSLMGPALRSMGDPWGFDTSTVAGVVIQHRSVAMIAAAALAAALVFGFFLRTRLGLAMRATAIDQEAALAQGVRVGRVFAVAWMMAGAMAALAGTFAGSGLGGFSTATASVAFKALPVVVVGGLDSIRGALMGALAVGLTEAWAATYQPGLAPFLGANFSQVVPFLVMVAVLLIKPYGLYGTAEVERV
jgi:branched-chain amino acid transport system permease protein